MLYSTVTPAEKRRLFRERLAGSELLQFPGAFNPLSARLIEQKGFDGVYISGAVLAADLGLPDIGLTTLTEVAGRAKQIARMTDLPAIVDADTGFGEPMNVARTIQELEDAGLAGAHIEDQVNPKRCGHLDGKSVVDENTAIKRIRAAADAHPLGARPFARDNYIAKFRILAEPVLEPAEIERFLETAQRLPELMPSELGGLNIRADLPHQGRGGIF